METVICIIFLIFVSLIALAYVWLIILSLIKVDWRNRWKIYIKEFIIVYIALWIIAAFLNPTCIELQQTVGWTRQTFVQITCISTLAFLVLLPFINIRNSKWNSLINVKNWILWMKNLHNPIFCFIFAPKIINY